MANIDKTDENKELKRQLRQAQSKINKLLSENKTLKAENKILSAESKKNRGNDTKVSFPCATVCHYNSTQNL